MIDFIKLELVKLKRLKQFYIIILGIIAPPILMFLSVLCGNFSYMDTNLFFEEIIMYSILLFNIIIFSLILGVLIVSEYNNHTLKSVLAAPISKNKYILGKFLTFEVLVILLTLLSFILSVIFGFVVDIGEICLITIVKYLSIFLIGNILLSWVLTVFLLISLIFRNIVPVVIISTILAFVNVMVYGESYASIFPFASPLIIASNQLTMYGYGIIVPIILLLLTGLFSLILSLIYFNNADLRL